MPKICDNLHLSDSLFRLITDSAKNTKCCRLLTQIFERVQSGTQAKGDCPCPECRRARKGQKWLNEKRIGDYFSFREAPGKISYMPKGKTQIVNDDGTWARKGRVEISPVKWIKSMFHPRLAKRLGDHEWSPFATALKAEEEAQKISFKFVPFSDAYSSSNYSEDGRPDSCMWGKDVGPFYKMLGAKAVVAVNGRGHYVGRAVFWPHVKTPQGEIKLLDRIYTRTPEITQLFKAYAKEQGWYVKYKQNRSNLREVIDPEKEEMHSWIMTVEAKGEFDDKMYFPYLDTFQGGKDNESVTNLHHDHDKSVLYEYHQTDGSRGEHEDHTGEVCTFEGVWIPEADSCYVSGYGTAARSDTRFRECHHSSDWYHRNYMVYIKHEGFWVHKDYKDEYLTPEEREKRAEDAKARQKKDEKLLRSLDVGYRTIEPATIEWSAIQIPPEFAGMFTSSQGTTNEPQF